MQKKKKKIQMKNKKAQLTLYVVWFLSAIIILVVAAFLAPMGVLFNSELYKAGEEIMLDANESIQGIQNDSMRTQITAVITEALDAQENNIEINSDLFQYSWVFVLILSGIVVFLFTRRTVEFSYGGGFVG